VAPAGGATVLHVDLDAFYASVEQLLDPGLRGRPVAVGEGVVLAASYEAKAYGVRAAMPGWRARQLCPGLRFVRGHFGEYQRLGDQVMDVLDSFTPLVERISIDEAFLDVAGTQHLFGSPADVALAIRRRVRAEVGLAVSVGVARTKHLAKIASQVAKPDGLVVVEPEREVEFLRPLPVELVWGVGQVTGSRLAGAGVRTIGDLSAMPGPVLKAIIGQASGSKLHALAGNVDPRPVRAARRAGSVGAQYAFGRRPATLELLRTALGYLADRVARRLRAAGRAGRTVTVTVRFTELRSVTRSVTLRAPVSATLTLTDLAVELAGSALADHPGESEITLLAVSVSQLVDESSLQLELSLDGEGDRRRPGTAAGSARWALDRAVDAIRARFGANAVGYARVMLSELGGVPEEFRELAERELRAPPKAEEASEAGGR
jgi:DNA polymerase-4